MNTAGPDELGTSARGHSRESIVVHVLVSGFALLFAIRFSAASMIEPMMCCMMVGMRRICVDVDASR